MVFFWQVPGGTNAWISRPHGFVLQGKPPPDQVDAMQAAADRALKVAKGELGEEETVERRGDTA